MKTKEELNAIKEEIETLNGKLAELTEDEVMQITGGTWIPPVPDIPQPHCYIAVYHCNNCGHEYSVFYFSTPGYVDDSCPKCHSNNNSLKYTI